MEHQLAAEPSDAERAAVDVVLAHRAAAPDSSRRDLLLPALRALQQRVGWISEGGLSYVSRQLDVAPADVYGVASFYSLLSLRAAPARIIHVCTDLACKLNGADELLADVDATPLTAIAETSAWHPSPCLGLCDHAPAALVIHAGDPSYSAPMASVDALAIDVARHGGVVDEWPAAASVWQRDSGDVVLLRRVGVVNPHSLDDYLDHDGYRALERAIALGPAQVVAEIAAARLVGRGGAAFPTARKWESVASHSNPIRYLVANADESEPGTFKDRVLMEGDPFAVVEAMTIAAFATGCRHGIIYLRGEYPVAYERLQVAIDAARHAGRLGFDIAGRQFAFDIEIRQGAGAYICGEETAIFNSIEGRRGEPRNKPPYPTDKGLFGCPTVVNNIETLVNVLPILLEGAAAYADRGTVGSAGNKLFCVSGNVTRPGVYEVAFGVTLRELLTLAGGVAGGRPLQCVLLGGAAGTFVGPSDLDVPLTFEGTRAIGASLGSGVVLVVDDRADIGALLRRIAEFFRDESCGQCVPCRIGTVRQEELLERLAAGRPMESVDREQLLLRDIGQAMRDASICGLGQTATNAIESAFLKLEPFRRSR